MVKQAATRLQSELESFLDTATYILQAAHPIVGLLRRRVIAFGPIVCYGAIWMMIHEGDRRVLRSGGARLPFD